MNMIDQIKADREDGTPGPWGVSDEWNVDGPDYQVVAGSASVTCDFESDANARRIARVPDMEAALLAAVELAESLAWMLSETETNRGDTPLQGHGNKTWDEINEYWIAGEDNAAEALAAFRSAIEVK